MKARDVMTENPACCTPQDTAQAAATAMEQHDCGCLPVVEDQESRRIVGVVTDRDLALRALGHDKGPDTRVQNVMSNAPSCCKADDDIETVERIMAERQVRRVPVVDDQECCIGIVAQADLVRHVGTDRGSVTDQRVARTVGSISEPASQPRRD